LGFGSDNPCFLPTQGASQGCTAVWTNFISAVQDGGVAGDPQGYLPAKQLTL